MEALLRAAREAGYLTPRRPIRTLAELQDYLNGATLADMTVEGLRRLAREHRLSTGGVKRVLIERLQRAGIQPPPVNLNALPRTPPQQEVLPVRPPDLERKEEDAVSAKPAASSSSGPGKPFEPQPWNGEACLTQWSEEYLRQYAEYYGVSPKMSAADICMTLEALQYDMKEAQTFRVTVAGRGVSSFVFWPLLSVITRPELDAIARRVGAYARSGMSNRELIDLLNRVVGAGSAVRINYEQPPLPPPALPAPVFVPYVPAPVGPVVVFPTSNENLPAVPGCFNRDVPIANIGARYTDELGHVYCFHRDQLEPIRTAGVNPYTGKPLSANFLGPGNAPPSPQMDCTPCPAGPNVPCTNTAAISETARRWLRNWMGPGVFGKHKAVYYVPPEVRLNLAKFKRCEPVVAYRGLHFTEQDYRDYVTYNRRDRFTPITLNSWTTNRRTAEGYSGLVGQFSILMKATLRPEDIFVDLTVAINALVLGGSQSEVIALPGYYDVEVISDTGPKDIGMVSPVRVMTVASPPDVSASSSSATPPIRQEPPDPKALIGVRLPSAAAAAPRGKWTFEAAPALPSRPVSAAASSAAAASSSTSYIGKVVTSGPYVEIRVEGLDPSELYRQAQNHVNGENLPWQIKPPASWSQGSGPHITLAPDMKKYLGYRVSGIKFGRLYHFTTSTSRWVVIAVTLPAAYRCGYYECHLSIGQEILGN
jgi:hypothetical protein